MKKLLKILLGVIATIVLLIVAAGVLLPIIYDTDDLKRTVSTQVETQTGRKLAIDGDLDFSVFPWLALDINDVSLANAAGFGDEPFAQIGQAKIGVALMPLLRDEIMIDEVVLSDLKLNLAVDSNGRSNWEDLAGDSESGSTSSDTTDLASGKIAGLNLSNAEISYRDDQAGLQYRLSDLNLKTGALGEGGPIPIELTMALEDLVAGTQRDVTLNADATVSLGSGEYLLEGFELTASDPTAGSVPIKLAAPRLEANLEAQTLELPAFTATLAGTDATGGISAQNIVDDPSFTGALTLVEFSPRELMSELGMEAPQTTDSQVLGKASLDAVISGNANELNLSAVQIVLDDSRMTGEASVRNFDQPVVRFDLAVDRIDIDRYMAPADDTESTSDEAADVAIPTEDLAGLDVEGTLRAAELILAGLMLTEAEVGLRIRNDKLRLHPLTAAFYGGRYDGNVRLDASGDVPVIRVNEKVESVIFEQLASDLIGQNNVSGTAVGHFRGSGQGLTSSEVLGSLEGSMGLNLAEGALEGIDVWYEIRKALAMVKGQAPPDNDAGRTVFSRLNLEASMLNGIMTMDDLTGQLPFLDLDGSGTIDLAAMALDLGLVASVRNLPELDQDPLASDLKGRSIPLRITGSAMDPKIAVDVQELLKSEATQQILDRVLGSKEGEEPDPNKDAARSLIQGLIGGSSKSSDDDDDD